MTDYIERTAAIKVVEKYFENTLGLNSDICVDGIRSISSEDVRPVVWGEWVNRGYESGCVGLCDCYRCTACNTTWDAKSHFCPNCGAEMVTDCNKLEEDEGRNDLSRRWSPEC